MSKAVAGVIPIPKKHAEKLVQAEIDSDLVEAVTKVRHRDGATLKSVIEYGFKVYLIAGDPEVAKAMGILK